MRTVLCINNIYHYGTQFEKIFLSGQLESWLQIEKMNNRKYCSYSAET